MSTMTQSSMSLPRPYWLAACLSAIAFGAAVPAFAEPSTNSNPAQVIAQRFATDTEKSEESEILKRAREEKLQREADEKALAARKAALDKKKLEDEVTAKKLADEKAIADKKAADDKRLAEEKIAEERKAQEKLAAEKAEAERVAAAKLAEEKRVAEQKVEKERLAAEQQKKEQREAEEWKAAQIKDRQQREAAERAANDAKTEEANQKKAAVERAAEQDRIAEKLKRAREQRLDQAQQAEIKKPASKPEPKAEAPKAEAKVEPKSQPRVTQKAESTQDPKSAPSRTETEHDLPRRRHDDWAYGDRHAAPRRHHDGMGQHNGMGLGRPPHPRGPEGRWQRDDDDDDNADNSEFATNDPYDAPEDDKDVDNNFGTDDGADVRSKRFALRERGDHGPGTDGDDLENVTVLLEMKPGHRGIRRLNQVADPVLCVGELCYISAGAERPSRGVPRMAALGPFNTFGMRAGACRRSLTCVFRGVDLTTLGRHGITNKMQPVDMRFLRHDRRAAVEVTEDSNCRARPGRLACARKIDGDSWTAWIVPEDIAREAGTSGLLAALKRGLSTGRSAALEK